MPEEIDFSLHALLAIISNIRFPKHFSAKGNLNFSNTSHKWILSTLVSILTRASQSENGFCSWQWFLFIFNIPDSFDQHLVIFISHHDFNQHSSSSLASLLHWGGLVIFYLYPSFSQQPTMTECTVTFHWSQIIYICLFDIILPKSLLHLIPLWTMLENTFTLHWSNLYYFC